MTCRLLDSMLSFFLELASACDVDSTIVRCWQKANVALTKIFVFVSSVYYFAFEFSFKMLMKILANVTYLL